MSRSMVRRKVIAVASALTVGALALSGCGATNSGNGESGGSDVGSDNVNTKWADCTPGHGSKDTTSMKVDGKKDITCLLYTSPSPRDRTRSRMPSSA